jgi:hypothetical protein
MTREHCQIGLAYSLVIIAVTVEIAAFVASRVILRRRGP